MSDDGWSDEGTEFIMGVTPPAPPRGYEPVPIAPEQHQPGLIRGAHGCSGKALLALVLVALVGLAVGALTWGGGDDGDDEPAATTPIPCPQAFAGMGAARATPCTAAPETTPAATATAAPTTVAGEATIAPAASPTTVAGGGPPDPASLPPGAVLYRGTSGDVVGCIPCDGLFRFVSVERPGVLAGLQGGAEEQSLLAAPLPTAGVVKGLGARLSAADGGKWTINVRCAGPQVAGSCNRSADTPVDPSVTTSYGFILACPVPQGETLCVSPDDDPGAPVSAGDRLVVSVGNPGDPATDGRFTFEWWFVYQPAA